MRVLCFRPQLQLLLTQARAQVGRVEYTPLSLDQLAAGVMFEGRLDGAAVQLESACGQGDPCIGRASASLRQIRKNQHNH
eukprot:1172349-Prorocentrum_minimum.AAC.1